MKFLKIWLVQLALAVTAAVPATAASAPAANPDAGGKVRRDRDEASTSKPLAPLPKRSGARAMDAVRTLSMTQNKIAFGSVDALRRLPGIIADIAQDFEALPAEAWKDVRNQRAAIRIVLGGGSPNLLVKLVKAKVIAEQDRALAEGALAYAYGDRRQAADRLELVDAATLGPSLGSLVALVKCVLKADTDADTALPHCDEARLLSPGTLVEETALRVSIELMRNLRRAVGSARVVSLYLRRFGRSLYLTAVLPAIASSISDHDMLGSPKGVDWLAVATRDLPQDTLHTLLFSVSEEALRQGKLATAAAAARQLFDSLSPSSLERPRAMAYLGAALMLSVERDKANELIAAAEEARLPSSVNELVAAVRVLAESITAPAIAPPRWSASTVADARPLDLGGGNGAADVSAGDGEATPTRVNAVIAEADRVLAEASE